MTATYAVRLTIDDLLTGTCIALARHGKSGMYIGPKLDEILSRFTDALSEDTSIDVRFRVVPHPIWGDSQTVADALLAGVQRGLIRPDGPELAVFDFVDGDLDQTWERLPKLTAYDQLARAIIDADLAYPW